MFLTVDISLDIPRVDTGTNKCTVYGKYAYLYMYNVHVHLTHVHVWYTHTCPYTYVHVYVCIEALFYC